MWLYSVLGRNSCREVTPGPVAAGLSEEDNDVVVTALVKVCVSGEDLLGAKPLPPINDATIESLPAGRSETEIETAPSVRVPVPRTVEPVRIRTAPVGVP